MLAVFHKINPANINDQVAVTGILTEEREVALLYLPEIIMSDGSFIFPASFLNILKKPAGVEMEIHINIGLRQ